MPQPHFELERGEMFLKVIMDPLARQAASRSSWALESDEGQKAKSTHRHFRINDDGYQSANSAIIVRVQKKKGK